MPHHTMILRFISFFLFSLVLVSCENGNVGQIEWLIPMQPSQDHHTTSKIASQVPAWAVHENMSADINLLSKHKARNWDYHLSAGKPATRGDMTIELLGVTRGLRVQQGSYVEDQTINNPAAWLRVMKQGHVVYEGWMYQNFPELFGLEDPEWWISLKGIQLTPVNKE